MILILILVSLLVVLYIQTNGSMEPSLLDSVSYLLAYLSVDTGSIESDLETIGKDIEDEVDTIVKDIEGELDSEKEVFHIPNQMFTYNEAKLFCESIGVRLATLN